MTQSNGIFLAFNCKWFLSKHTNVCFTLIWSMEFFQIARLPTPFVEFFQEIVETFDLVHGIFSQNSSSSETIHGIFSRYHWDFLEEFFGQFHTCKFYMKIRDKKIRNDAKQWHILSLLIVNDFCQNTPTYALPRFNPWNFFE